MLFLLNNLKTDIMENEQIEILKKIEHNTRYIAGAMMFFKTIFWIVIAFGVLALCFLLN